jgi:hypothetical protein
MPVNAPIKVLVHAPPAMQAARFTEEEGTRDLLVAASRPSLGNP